MSSVKQYNLQPSQVFNGPVTATVTSSVTEILNKDNVSYSYVWTGNLVGTFSVQTSNDYMANGLSTGTPPVNAGTWDTVPISGAAAAGTADHGTIELNNLGAKYVRTVFTYTSGSGNLTATIVAKAL